LSISGENCRQRGFTNPPTGSPLGSLTSSFARKECFMPSSLKSVLTKLLPFRNTSCEKFEKQVEEFKSAEALKKSETLLPGKEVGAMLKIGDKVTVQVKITKIELDENGVQYVVAPVKGSSYNSMKLTEKDFTE